MPNDNVVQDADWLPRLEEQAVALRVAITSAAQDLAEAKVLLREIENLLQALNLLPGT